MATSRISIEKDTLKFEGMNRFNIYIGFLYFIQIKLNEKYRVTWNEKKNVQDYILVPFCPISYLSIPFRTI